MEELAETPPPTSILVVHLRRDRAGQLRGWVERPRTGAKEGFESLPAIGHAIGKLVDREARIRSGLPPPRGHFVIRDAYVMTMDEALGDIPVGDVEVDAGRIVAVGSSVPAPGVEALDGRGMIVLPGFVDAHTHLWTTQMRGRFGHAPDGTYRNVRNALAGGYTAEDMYQGTRLGAAEAVFSGITTTVDFCHNVRGPDVVEACLRGLRETGIRARFLLGASTEMTPSDSIDLAYLERLDSTWASAVDDAPVSLGLGWRGPLATSRPMAAASIDPASRVARDEFETARRLNLPIAVHVSGATAAAQFDALVRGGFLGADVQLIHLTGATAEQLAIATDAGASIALTPMTELRVGFGITRLGDYLAGGARVGLGVDSASLAGAADMFAIMKLGQRIEAGRCANELAISARRLLELATIDGARSIGMADAIGSITPGKRADLIMVATRAINMGRFAHDPAHLLVEAAQPANVDTVIVDGRILKRSGRLAALDIERIIAEAEQSLTAILHRI